MVSPSHSVIGQSTKTDYPREVCEHALAHKLPNEMKRAYLRGGVQEKRKRPLNPTFSNSLIPR